MIGNKVEAELYGNPSKGGIMLASVKNGLPGTDIVYAVFHKQPEVKRLKAIVIAVAYANNRVRRVIVAPENDAIFYEPELRERLQEIKGLCYDKLQCLYEKSCGAVVFHRIQGEPKVLLVKNKNGRYWSFPKGHIEKDEDESQTALREIKEETGLDVKILDGFRETSEYSPFGKIRKRVVFFLAESFTDKVDIQEEEIDYYIWVSFKEAKSMCCYNNDISVLKNAEKLISKTIGKPLAAFNKKG